VQVASALRPLVMIRGRYVRAGDTRGSGGGASWTRWALGIFGACARDASAMISDRLDLRMDWRGGLGASIGFGVAESARGVPRVGVSISEMAGGAAIAGLDASTT
jgi:hypothetical protein